jgi:nitrogen fixation protein FixH
MIRSIAQWKVTGRAVFFSLLSFFAIVAIVNATMMTLAVSTFGGVETASSYKASLAFAGESKAASAQDALRWDVRLDLASAALRHGMHLQAVDSAGQGLSGVSVQVRFAHPTDRRADVVFELHETSVPGRYTVAAVPPAGQWDVIVELAQAGKRLFRSKSRVLISSL